MKPILIAIIAFSLSKTANAQDMYIENDMNALKTETVEKFNKDNELAQLQSVTYANVYSPRPGDELIKFSRMFYAGYALMGGGYMMMIVGGINYNPEIVLLGGLVSLGGMITTIASHHHIGKAGKIMNQLDDQYRREMEKKNTESSFKFNLDQHGVGIAYKL